MKNKLPEKVLVLMLDHIGDTLWKTPALAALRRNLPEARITVLLTPYVREVLEGNPDLDELMVYQPQEGRLAWQKRQLMKPLRSQAQDWAICLDPRDEANLLAFYSGAKIRAGFYYLDKPLSIIKSWFTLNRRWVHPAESGKKTGEFPHEVEVNLQLLKKLGLDREAEKGIVFSLSEKDRRRAQELLAGRPVGPALHLEPKWLSGNWDREYLKALLSALAEQYPQDNILLTYGPGGEALAEELAYGLGSRFIPAGGVSVKQWAALLEQCRLFIGRDGGSTHVAGAVRRKVLTIFEQEKYREHRRWVPWDTQYRAIFREEERGDDAGYVKKHIGEILASAKELYGG